MHAAERLPNHKTWVKVYLFVDTHNNVKNNKEILKKTSRYVDQIGSHLTKAKSEITSNYESAIDRFRVIEKKNKLI